MRALSLLLLPVVAEPFAATPSPSSLLRQATRLHARPQRLADNVDGVIYVNDKCINCAACNNFAPETFARASSGIEAHVVYRQPETESELAQARSALAACPVAAIRLETKAERRNGWSDQDQALANHLTLKGNARPFPRPFLDNVPGVYWTGHHNDASFGATPYLVQATVDKQVWIMVDVPRFNKQSVQDVTSVTGPGGPDYLFLTHVDDTADHEKWAAEFPSLQRIMHGLELKNNWRRDFELNNVEILLEGESKEKKEKSGLQAFRIDGTPLPDNWLEDLEDDVVLIHTPGHSMGSVTMYKRPSEATGPGIFFTGDTYAYTTRHGGRMSGFPRYGRDLEEQADAVDQLLFDMNLEWDIVAPGHGLPRDYRPLHQVSKAQEYKEAAQELVSSRPNTSKWS